ncbi:MAG: hypothetical protein ACI95S_002004 [Dinoroseobacter sp.]|jgi:hypothetical protein
MQFGFWSKGTVLRALSRIPFCARVGNPWWGGAQWIDCALPDLVGVSGRFDLILVGAVWHVLEEDQHADALCRLAELLADKGRLIVSLKQAENAPVIMENAGIAAAGLEVQQVEVTPSIQAGNHALDVMWEWKVMRPKAVGQRS